MIKRLFSSVSINSIHVTENAWKKLSEISENQKIINFLFSAKSGGCNGFNYDLKLIDEEKFNNINDEESKMIKPTILSKNKIRILVDPVSEFLLLGTTIDYINEDYSSGIFENKFTFTPDKKLASSCGCGISFTPKNFD